MNRKRATILFLSAVLLVLVLVPCRLTWHKMRQPRLDRTLIASIQNDEADQALVALRQGADPNAFENDDPPLSFRQQLLQIVHPIPTTPHKPGYGHGERSALVLAIAGSEWAVARELMNRGASDINGEVYMDDGWGAEGFSLLQETIGENDDIARMLLQHGADPNAACDRGSRPLGCAVHANDLAMVIELVHRGADVNLGGYRDVPPLIEGAGYCSPAILRFLLEHGANPNAETPPDAWREYGHTALSEARKRPDGLSKEVMNLLRQFGAKK